MRFATHLTHLPFLDLSVLAAQRVFSDKNKKYNCKELRMATVSSYLNSRFTNVANKNHNNKIGDSAVCQLYRPLVMNDET